AALPEHDLLVGGQVAVDLAVDEHHARQYLGRELPFGADGDDVLPQVDLALDPPFDEEILLARNLSTHDDRSSNHCTSSRLGDSRRRHCCWFWFAFASRRRRRRRRRRSWGR